MRLPQHYIQPGRTYGAPVNLFIKHKGELVSDTSIELNDLMFTALDYAIGSIEEAAPLIPFVMVVSKDGNKKLTRFAHELLEKGLEAAQGYIHGEKDNIKTYTMAWDGFITIEGKKWDCIFVEAGERGTEQGVLLAQRYEKKGVFKKKNLPVGNPALAGHPISRLGV
ncbi:MAG: hypothetical protein LBV44_05280 [Methylobacillus sp.]|jgi:hypothetical protein|nr:hypothetical protein [Methylobacillus sp.]